MKFLLVPFPFPPSLSISHQLTHAIEIVRKTMASKEFLCFLFVCFFTLGSTTYCTFKSDCSYSESCCTDGVCREKCSYCSYNSECGTNEQCCDNKCISIFSTCSCSSTFDCGIDEQCCSSTCISSSSSCSCTYDSDCDIGEDCCGGVCSSHCGWSGGAIAGAIIGTIIFFAIIISIVSCLCCACCPYYRYRTPGTVIVTGQQPQQIVSTHTQMSTQQVHPPPPVNYNQPPPAGYNPPPQGFNQAPPPYPSYPPPPNQYPPPPGQAQAAPMPAAINAGQPHKF